MTDEEILNLSNEIFEGYKKSFMKCAEIKKAENALDVIMNAVVKVTLLSIMTLINKEAIKAQLSLANDLHEHVCAGLSKHYLNQEKQDEKM